MAKSLQSIGQCGMLTDTVTGEGGFVVKMINRTGGNSVKGQVVSMSTSTDLEIIKQANEFDSIGVIQEEGVPEASSCWVWVNGSVAQVLWKDGETSTRGYVALASDTDGRALNVAVPAANPVVAEHFKEIGHVMESKGSGTDVLVLCHLHFN